MFSVQIIPALLNVGRPSLQVSIDVRAPSAGTLVEQLAAEGDTVEVGAPLLKLDASGGGGGDKPGEWSAMSYVREFGVSRDSGKFLMAPCWKRPGIPMRYFGVWYFANRCTSVNNARRNAHLRPLRSTGKRYSESNGVLRMVLECDKDTRLREPACFNAFFQLQ